jgi:hypothetical protein
MDKIKAGVPSGNYFPELGPTEDNPDLRPEDWMKDIGALRWMRAPRKRGVKAYRQLNSLQGKDIPTFYHTFHLPPPHTPSSPRENRPSIPPPSENSDSLTPFEFDYVEGMALGYIDGWSMEDTKPDVNLSQVAIERAPKAPLQVGHRVHK